MTARDREEHGKIVGGLIVHMSRLGRQEQDLIDQLDAAHDRKVSRDRKVVDSLIVQILAVKNRIQTLEKAKTVGPRIWWLRRGLEDAC